MVVIRPLEASRSIDIGGIPDTRVDDSVGRGLQQVGNAVNQHAQRLIEMKRQDDNFAWQQAFNRWNDDNSLEFTKAQEGISVSGEGFAASNAKTMNERAEAFMKSVPPELQGKMQALVATAVNQWGNKGVAVQLDQRNSWQETTLNERATRLQGEVYNNPDQFQAAKESIFREIDASAWGDIKKDEMRKKVEEMLSLASAERDIRTSEANPSYANSAATRLGVSGAVKTSQGGDAMSILRKFEGFRDTPYWDINAHRVGYGSDTVTMADGRIVNVEKGMKISRADAERDLARRTKEFERTAAAQVGADNWNRLPAHVQAALVSVAYNYGSLPANVADATRSGDIGRIASSVEFRGNDNSGVNAKRRAEEAAIIRGSAHITSNAPPFDPSSMDPRYAGLTLQQRLTINDRMQAAAERGQTALNVQQRAAYDSEKGALQLGIQTGDVASDHQILQSRMTDSDKATLLSALRSRQGDQIMTAQAIADFQNGSLKVDPFSSDGKKKVDAIGAWIGKAVPQEQQHAVYEGLVRQSGSVPQSVLNTIRVGAESQMPSNVQQALELGSRLSQISRNAISTRDGGASVQDKIDLYDTFKKNGYDASEAAKRVAELNDPELAAKRQAIVKSEPVQKVLKKVSSSDVKKIYSGWFSSPNVGGQITDDLVEVGASFEAEAQIVADYKGMLEDAFYEANGNETVARELASKRMQKVYGLSETSFFGRNTIMRLPPEKTYDPLPDGSFAYIKEQLNEALKAEGIDFDEAWLESYGATDEDYQAKRPANYQIVFRKDDKLALYNLPFFADRDAALEKYNALEQSRVSEREAAWEQSRANEAQQYPEGRDGPERFANDQLYRGVAREGSPVARAIAAQQQKTNAVIQAVPSDQERNQKIDQFLGKPRALISTQRKQLFKDAKDNGTLPER
ncbi:MAG: hypothetical protein LBE54_11765 [Brucellaceae bacterium]|jgi:GH24 family phage-related lysozyme (muramidase)|nr:hypothetical protein [Brucellaceae bacterium]